MNVKLIEKLVLGSVQFGLEYGINNQHGKPKKEDSFQILDFANLNGIIEIDTAEAYGNSLEILCEYLKSNPNIFFNIFTKLSLKTGSFIKVLSDCLVRSGLNSFYGCYLHRAEDLHLKGVIPELSEAKKNGLVQKIGVSVYTNSELKSLIDIAEIDVIQLPFNVFDQSDEKIELLIEARKRGKKIYARSVFLQGLVFKNPRELTSDFQVFASNLYELNKITKISGLNMETICLLYVLQQDFIDKVIIGVDSKMQLQSNVESLKSLLNPAIVTQLKKMNLSNSPMVDPRNWKK